MSLPHVRKYPNAVRTVTFDFGPMLNVGDAVAAIVDVTIAPGGSATVGAGTLTGNTVSAQVTGGTAGSEYTVSCRVQTNQLDTQRLDVVVEVGTDAN